VSTRKAAEPFIVELVAGPPALMGACLDSGSALDESQFGLPGLSVQANCGGLVAELGDALPDKI
jgi:hypothetical protein